MTKVGPDIGQIILSPSENITLHGLGYRVMRKLGEGSYAKVFLFKFLFSNFIKLYNIVYRYISQNLLIISQIKWNY